MRRVIGMDIHRTFAEVVFWEDGKLRPAGRVSMTRSGLEGFGRSLGKEDEVVIEATGNAMAVVRVLSPYVPRVIVANSLHAKARGVRGRAVAEAGTVVAGVKGRVRSRGVNVIVAAGLVAGIGDVRRFSSPQQLASYVGLNPRGRQSGLGVAQHGRISKRGRSHARAMLVEAALAAAKAPGPLRAFFLRIRARRGHQIAPSAMDRPQARMCQQLLT